MGSLARRLSLLALLLAAPGCGSTEHASSARLPPEVVTRTVTAREATPDASAARNLVVTPEVRAALRDAHVPSGGATRGPLRGSVYLASYRGTRWAIATFRTPLTGTDDQPELFVQPSGAPDWIDVGDIGGIGPVDEVRVIPCPVRRAWGFECRGR